MEMVLSGLESVLDFAQAWNLQGLRRQGLSLPTPDWGRRRFLYGDICSLGAQYQRLSRLAPESRFMPVLLDDVIANPKREYLRVLRFLGLEDDGRRVFPVLNKARFIRWPQLHRAQFHITQAIAGAKRRAGIRFNLGIFRMIYQTNIVEGPRSPLAPEFQALLRGHFESDVALLGELLHRNLAGWLGSNTEASSLQMTTEP
jgi:hypothetical protein